MANTSHASDCGSLRLRVVGVDWGCGGQASRDIYGRCAGSRGNGHGFRYVVTLDRLGSAVSVTRADQMQKMDEKVIKSLLARWTADVRGVVSDGTAQRQMIDRTYSMLSNGTRALSMVNEYYKNDPPTTRSATSAVSVEISSVIPITDKTWQVEWEETTRSTQGGITGKQRWKANLTIALNPPTTEAQIFKNPIGLYIVDLSWSQTL